MFVMFLGFLCIYKGGGVLFRVFWGLVIEYKVYRVLFDVNILLVDVVFVEVFGLGELFGDVIEIGVY